MKNKRDYVDKIKSHIQEGRVQYEDRPRSRNSDIILPSSIDLPVTSSVGIDDNGKAYITRDMYDEHIEDIVPIPDSILSKIIYPHPSIKIEGVWYDEDGEEYDLTKIYTSPGGFTLDRLLDIALAFQIAAFGGACAIKNRYDSGDKYRFGDHVCLESMHHNPKTGAYYFSYGS